MGDFIEVEKSEERQRFLVPLARFGYIHAHQISISLLAVRGENIFAKLTLKIAGW